MLLLNQRLDLLLSLVKVSAFRLFLKTPDVFASTPMIRGVWGRALMHLDQLLYDHIFLGKTVHAQNLPRYIIRPAPFDPNSSPALDYILFNVKKNDEQMLWRAWDMACAMGLGKYRNPFVIKERKVLKPANATQTSSWTLADATWPLIGNPAPAPCILRADVPLRIIKQSQLVKSPSFTDLMVASIRRISSLAGLNRGEKYADLVRTIKSEATEIIANRWVGEKCNLVRWSAAQQKEVELFGITGSITLPEGPGSLWPVLSASQWCHIGKGTVYGMGELRIETLPSSYQSGHST